MLDIRLKPFLRWQSRAGQSTVELGGAGLGRVEQGKGGARLRKVGQGRTGQDRAGQGSKTEFPTLTADAPSGVKAIGSSTDMALMNL